MLGPACAVRTRGWEWGEMDVNSGRAIVAFAGHTSAFLVHLGGSLCG